MVRVRWWLGLRLGLKEFPQSPFVITKQFVAGRLRMIHGSQGFLVLPMVKVWSTWTSWGLIGVKALVISRGVSWNLLRGHNANSCSKVACSPEISHFQWPNTNYECPLRAFHRNEIAGKLGKWLWKLFVFLVPPSLSTGPSCWERFCEVIQGCCGSC